MLSWRRRATSIHCSPSPRGNRTGSSVCCVFPGAAPPSGRILSKRKAGSKTPESKRFRGLKLSTKCRQLESPKWKLPKKFPFWQELNVKGGIPSPSPLHNPPMRVQASPHRFVYSLGRPLAASFFHPFDQATAGSPLRRERSSCRASHPVIRRRLRRRRIPTAPGEIYPGIRIK